MCKENIHLLYGPPGSGKSTLAKELSRSTGYDYVSIGDLTRSEILSGSVQGQALKKCLDQVVEYPTDLISSLVEDHLLQKRGVSGFIIDGFPKYENEAKAFLAMAKIQDFKIQSILIVEITLEEALSRVANRRICLVCLTQTNLENGATGKCPECGGTLAIRDDDRPEILTRRYNDFRGAIDSVKGVLKDLCPNTRTIDGTLSQKQMVEKALEIINNKPE